MIVGRLDDTREVLKAAGAHAHPRTAAPPRTLEGLVVGVVAHYLGILQLDPARRPQHRQADAQPPPLRVDLLNGTQQLGEWASEHTHQVSGTPFTHVEFNAVSL